MAVTVPLDIAVTDKNPHVREFLCRELAGLGHRAAALAGAGELLELLAGPRPPQVLLLDPEALGARLAEVGRMLGARAAEVAVLLHVFEGAEPQPGFAGALVVEKEPHMGALKAALAALAAEAGGDSGTQGAAARRDAQEQA